MLLQSSEIEASGSGVAREAMPSQLSSAKALPTLCPQTPKCSPHSVCQDAQDREGGSAQEAVKGERAQGETGQTSSSKLFLQTLKLMS